MKVDFGYKMEGLNLRGKEFTNDILGVSMTCYKDHNNEPWFVGSQVARVLGYNNTRQAIRLHVDTDERMPIGRFMPSDEGGLPDSPPLRGGNVQPHAWLINESGLYSLIFGSSFQKAKDFRKWVTKEVLPSIREYGYYALPGVLDAIKAIYMDGIRALNEKDRTEFRKVSKSRSDAAKDPKKVRSGRKGGGKIQAETRRLKEEIRRLKEENEDIEKNESELLNRVFELEARLGQDFSYF